MSEHLRALLSNSPFLSVLAFIDLRFLIQIVCGIERAQNKYEKNNTKPIILNVVPIAGSYIHEGVNLDPKWTRFKSSPSHSDREKEGIRLEIHGKKHNGLKQMAVIEFLCDANTEEQRRSLPTLEPREEGDDNNDGVIPHFNEEEDDGHGGRIKFQGYNRTDDTMILSLEWKTKNACEEADNPPSNGSDSGHWGFFTWLIIMFVFPFLFPFPPKLPPNAIPKLKILPLHRLFLAIAAYLIFGSWLNYNRYSARGWDLVPHSETIRDLPYLLRDWGRRVVNTFSGGGSRGGYSAV